MLEILKNSVNDGDANIPLRIGIVCALIIFIYSHFIAFDNTNLRNVDMEPFSEPIQTDIENGEPFEHKVKDGVAKITPLAKYKIYGRVYAHHYRPYKLYGASMYPYDVSIGFGDFRYKDVYKAVDVKMAGTISYYTISGANARRLQQKYLNQTDFFRCFTNNHLCPANKKVKRGIQRLRNKDIVYIEGYLIKYELLRKNGRFESGTSSTSRDDKNLTGNNGSGSCEQIYVTRIVTRHGDYK